MKVLIVKTSSLGDIIHTFPALTDAANAIKNLKFDWIVEEAFTEIPSWHSAVNRVIPIAIRRWRKNWLKAIISGEIKKFKNKINLSSYDLVIDAQGLLKSAIVSRLSKNTIHGFDKKSAKEKYAAFFYNHQYNIKLNQHAVERTRQLFAKSIGYKLPTTTGEFNINPIKNKNCHFYTKRLVENAKSYLLFLHGTTRPDKHWPDEYWKELALIAIKSGYSIMLPWINDAEKQRAYSIAQRRKNIIVLPKLDLTSIAYVIKKTTAVISVDSGLSHLTAALKKPIVSIYGLTDPLKIGTYGENQYHLTPAQGDEGCQREVQPAIFSKITPKYVWSNLQHLIKYTDKKQIYVP